MFFLTKNQLPFIHYTQYLSICGICIFAQTHVKMLISITKRAHNKHNIKIMDINKDRTKILLELEAKPVVIYTKFNVIIFYILDVLES